MQRWLTHVFIACYLSVLFYGVASYAISFSVSNHPSTYFFIWDMFCGWSAYESRIQIVGQGESGRYYSIDPPPWGEYKPFGEIGRRHYDAYGFHASRLAANVLDHTQHEPISKVFIIEEAWPKKFNLPEHIWYRRYSDPKDVHRYYNVRAVLDGDGNLQQVGMSWYAYQSAMSFSDNPRLQTDRHRGQPFYAIDFNKRNGGMAVPNGMGPPMSMGSSIATQPVSVLGN